MAAAVAIPSICSEYLCLPVCLADCELCANLHVIISRVGKHMAKTLKAKESLTMIIIWNHLKES